jgi:acetyl/propionyl-CoA carboxylase alpha subunit
MAEALSITIGGRTARVDSTSAEGFTVDGGATFDVVYGPARGEVVIRIADRQRRLFVARSTDATWIFLEGRTYVASVDLEGAARSRSAHGQGSVMAPMPATVIAVNVRPGDVVKGGDVLVLLEAMKMELPLRAGGDAIVIAVHCAAGDLVQPNVALVDLEAPRA